MLHEHIVDRTRAPFSETHGSRMRLVYSLLIILTPSIVSCSSNDNSSIMMISATTKVDNRVIKAGTPWLITTQDTISGGAASSVRGVALAIPVARGRFIYGIFRTKTKTALLSWDRLVTGLDTFIAMKYPRGNRELQESYSAWHAQVTRSINGQPIPLCITEEYFENGISTCPVFVYFKDPKDLSTVKIINPGKPVSIDGRAVNIIDVSATYLPTGNYNITDKSSIPLAVKNTPNEPLTRLPIDFGLVSSRDLYKRDFWR